ncbi:hypothetical protein V8B97DRAFT_2009021 [Scleroderma yunnanense]
MPPHRNARRSRRLSRRSPVDAGDYTWDNSDHVQSLHTGTSPAGILPPVIFSPSPSTCTSNSIRSPSPSPIVTHLPFTPGSSHTRNRKKGHIPRPPNAFMVFRSWLWNKDNLKSVERDNRNVSRIAGRYWNELSEEERAPFRKMAEEAKARHAQLYPEYKYTPTFRKANKSAQRRSRLNSEDESARCKKVAELLIDGVQSSELTKYLDEASGDEDPNVAGNARERSPSIARATITLPTVSMYGQRAKKPTSSRTKPAPKPKKSRRVVPVFTPTPSYSPALAASSSLRPIDLKREDEATPMLLALTPELIYPPDEPGEFIPTDDIPCLSLDDCCETTPLTSSDLYSLPSNMVPATNTALCGVKLEAIPFVDECMLSAFNYYSPPPSTPFAIPVDPSYAHAEGSFQWFSPTHSPVIFSNPFEDKGHPSGRSPLLETLDQLFGQSVSPLTPASALATISEEYISSLPYPMAGSFEH